MGQQHRIINVAGNFIAEQHIGTYIAHAEHVHTNQPSSEWPACSGSYPNGTIISKPAEDVDFEDVTNPAKIPSMDQLNKVFTFKYRQELAFSLLIDFLADEKIRTDFYADSDWARYALTIYEWNPSVLQKRPNTFKEWLPKFCELFGRPFARDYEPNKLQFARENKIIPFLPLKETR